MCLIEFLNFSQLISNEICIFSQNINSISYSANCTSNCSLSISLNSLPNSVYSLSPNLYNVIKSLLIHQSISNSNCGFRSFHVNHFFVINCFFNIICKFIRSLYKLINALSIELLSDFSKHSFPILIEPFFNSFTSLIEKIADILKEI